MARRVIRRERETRGGFSGLPLETACVLVVLIARNGAEPRLANGTRVGGLATADGTQLERGETRRFGRGTEVVWDRARLFPFLTLHDLLLKIGHDGLVCGDEWNTPDHLAFGEGLCL